MTPSLATLATEFLARPHLTDKTIRSYEGVLTPLLKEYGAYPINQLTRRQLEQYLNQLTHLSYTTHNRHQAIIQSLFNFAVEQGDLAASPITRLKPHQPNRNQGEQGSDEVIRYLNQEQLARLYHLLGEQTAFVFL